MKIILFWLPKGRQLSMKISSGVIFMNAAEQTQTLVALKPKMFEVSFGWGRKSVKILLSYNEGNVSRDPSGLLFCFVFFIKDAYQRNLQIVEGIF